MGWIIIGLLSAIFLLIIVAVILIVSLGMALDEVDVRTYWIQDKLKKGEQDD